MYLVQKAYSIFKISILKIGCTTNMGTILHNGTTIHALCFREILYFSRISPVLIFVWFCITWTILLNDRWLSSIWIMKVENY
jgi:hypothetical protein